MLETFYIHNLRKPFNHQDFVKRFCPEFSKNTNATLVVNGTKNPRTLPSSALLNSTHLRSPLVTFSESSTFISAFTTNAYSSEFFQPDNIEKIPRHIDSNDMTSFLFESAQIKKINSSKFTPSKKTSWPKLTLKAFSDKIERVTKKIGQEISPPTVYNCHIPFTNISHPSDNSLFVHNEVHLKVGFHNVRSIAIHSADLNDFEIIARTLQLQYLIQTSRNEILEKIDQKSNPNLDYCIFVEIFKFKTTLQTIALCYRIQRLNELFPNYAANQMMQASFASKKMKNSEFDIFSESNQKTWIANQQKKIEKQITELENEIKSWSEKFSSILPIDKIELINSLLKKITVAGSLDEITDIYLKINFEINSFCDSVKEKAIGNSDNPITNTIISELRKEVFIEEFDPLNKEIEYFRRVDLASIIASNPDFKKIFIQFITHESSRVVIPYICLLMMKDEQSKAKLFEVLNNPDVICYMGSEPNYNIIKQIMLSDINFYDLKELIENQNFYDHFASFLINTYYLDFKEFKHNQIINVLFEKNKFELMIKLFESNKINVDDIITQFNLLDDSNKERFLKEDIRDQCIIIANLSYEKKIDQSFLERIFSSYSKQDLEQILKKIIPNSGREITKLKGLLFIKELLKNNLIDQSLFFSTISQCSPSNINLIALYSLNKTDESFKEIVKYLLENILIDEASIFVIPLAENFDREAFFLNLNEIVSGYRMQGCQSLMQYLIKTKNYKMLYYFLTNSKIKTLSKTINFDELFINDVLGSVEGINSLILLFKIHRDQINFENLSIDHAKKLACVLLKSNNFDLLKILLDKKKIANSDEIEAGTTLLDYAYSNLNMDIINFLRERDRDIPEQAQPLIIRAELGEPSELIQSSIAHQQNLDRIIAQYRVEKRPGEHYKYPLVNFINIAEAQIDELINALKFNPKKIDLSRLQNFLDHNARLNDIENFNIKLKDFFIRLSRSDIGNIEEIDLGYNKLDIGFISGLIADNDCKTMFGKLKKLNLQESLFLFCKNTEIHYIYKFFDMIKDNIEELDLSSGTIFRKTTFKITETLTGLKNCKKLKKINLTDFKSEDLSSLSKILEMPNLTEIIFSQPSFGNYDDIDQDLEQISSKLKEHRNLEKLTIALPDFRHREIMADNLIFNYTLREITTDSPAREYDRINVNLQRNQIIFFKSKELYGEDHGSLLGKNLKDMQLKLVEIIVDEKLIKRIMDVIIKELLKSKEPNVDNLMRRIKDENLEFTEINKNKLQEVFRNIFVNSKRVRPKVDISQSSGYKRLKLGSSAEMGGMGGAGGAGD